MKLFIRSVSCKRSEAALADMQLQTSFGERSKTPWGLRTSFTMPESHRHDSKFTTTELCWLSQLYQQVDFVQFYAITIILSEKLSSWTWCCDGMNPVTWKRELKLLHSANPRSHTNVIFIHPPGCRSRAWSCFDISIAGLRERDIFFHHTCVISIYERATLHAFLPLKCDSIFMTHEYLHRYQFKYAHTYAQSIEIIN